MKKTQTLKGMKLRELRRKRLRPVKEPTYILNDWSHC